MAFTFIWDSGMFLHLVKYMYMHKTLHISLIKSIAIYVHIIWNNTAIGPYYFVEFNPNETDYLLCVIQILKHMYIVATSVLSRTWLAPEFGNMSRTDDNEVQVCWINQVDGTKLPVRYCR